MEEKDSRVFALKGSNSPTCTCFCRQDQYIAVGTSSGRILLLPLLPKQIMKKFPGHKKAITCMSIKQDGDIIVTGSEDTTVQILRNGETSVIRPNDGIIKFVSVSQVKPIVLICGEDGSPSLWNIITQEPLVLMKQFASPITGAAMAPNGKIYAIASEENGCFLYNTEDGRPIVSIPTQEVVSCISFAEDSGLLALGEIDGSILVYDYVHRNIICEKDVHRSKVVAVALHPCFNILVSSSSDGMLHISNPLDLKPRFSIEGNEGVPITISFSDDGEHYTTASNKQKVYLFKSPQEEDMAIEEVTHSDSENDEKAIFNRTHVSVQNGGFGSESEEEEEEVVEQPPPSEEETQMLLLKALVSKIFDLQGTIEDIDSRLKTMATQIVRIEAIQQKFME